MEELAQSTEPVKTAIRPNIANMVKTKGGSYHKDDFIGTTLAGLTVEQVLNVGKENGIDISKYAHLNPGQQRMTVGNILRKKVAFRDVPEINGKPDQKVADANEAAASVRDFIQDMADAARQVNEVAKSQKEADKAAKAVAKQASGKAKSKAAVSDSEGGEI